MSDMNPATREDYTTRLRRVLVYIQHNLDEALSLENLARVALFSPFHFHRVFSGMVGESVQRHVRRLRLERAAFCLKHTTEPISRIAFDAGFEAHEAFTRSFRRAFDCTPSDFRAARGLPARIPSPNGIHFTTATDSLQPVFIQELLMNVEIKTLPDMRVAYVRHVGPYDGVGAAWEKLTDWVGYHCLFGPEHELFGACWHDPEITPPDQIIYDACVCVGSNVAISDDLPIQTFSGGRFAVALHEGPYDQLNSTYATLFGVWFATQVHEPGDLPTLEFYLNDPSSTEPEDLLTDVSVRIQ